METAARIGPSIRIKGEIHSGEPLVVAGHIDGTIEVNGHPLTVDPGGSLEATVSAHTIIVSGKASGLLSATDKIVIKEGAAIHGDVSAPVISLAAGATFNGRIETAQKAKAALPIAS
jgi:cytoskeletal protein CcmA (bactofilin family)